MSLRSLRERLAGLLCLGCKCGDPTDQHGRHVRKWIDAGWHRESWIKCTADSHLIESILRAVEEEMR